MEITVQPEFVKSSVTLSYLFLDVELLNIAPKIELQTNGFVQKMLAHFLGDECMEKDGTWLPGSPFLEMVASSRATTSPGTGQWECFIEFAQGDVERPLMVLFGDASRGRRFFCF